MTNSSQRTKVRFSNFNFMRDLPAECPLQACRSDLFTLGVSIFMIKRPNLTNSLLDIVKIPDLTERKNEFMDFREQKVKGDDKISQFVKRATNPAILVDLEEY